MLHSIDFIRQGSTENQKSKEINIGARTSLAQGGGTILLVGIPLLGLSLEAAITSCKLRFRRATDRWFQLMGFISRTLDCRVDNLNDHVFHSFKYIPESLGLHGTDVGAR